MCHRGHRDHGTTLPHAFESSISKNSLLPPPCHRNCVLSASVYCPSFRLFLMSTPRKGKKGGGRRSPSPRASPLGSSPSEPRPSFNALEVSGKPQELQISELLDAGNGCDEARLLVSPSAMNAMALRGGELVLLQWRSVNGSISSCIGSSTSSASSSSDADSLLAPCMSIVLTAFPSISLAPHRAAAHPSILSCVSPPCRFAPNPPHLISCSMPNNQHSHALSACVPCRFLSTLFLHPDKTYSP